MPDELLFTVTGSTAVPARPITLAEAGLRERSDLQEWVLAHPSLLGSGVRIVTFEFDRWRSSSGNQPHDRLDVLGLDERGYLVVAELKRDLAPDTVEMQAIKYAAMSSRFSMQALAEQHAAFLTQRGQSTSDSEALDLLTEHAPEMSPDTLRRPRIVLLAGEYPPAVTATTVWLTEMGLDITLMQFQAYRTPSEIVLTVSQLYPVRDVEEFTIAPRLAEARSSEERQTKARESNTVKRLINAGILPDGTSLTISVRNDVNAEIRDVITRWLDEAPSRRRATWQNKGAAPLVWEADGNEYTPTGLIRSILMQAASIDRAVAGPRWWVDARGYSLSEVAGTLGGKDDLYEQFWARFMERQREEHPDWSNMRIPPATNWITMPSRIRGTEFGVNFAANGRMRSELYIDSGDTAENKRRYHALEAKRTEIERAYGDRLTWEELANRQASRIAAYGEGDVANRDHWEEYIDWFFDSGVRLRRALAPHVI